MAKSVVNEETVFYRHSPNEIAYLGYTKRQNVEIRVHGGEGPVPHLHFITNGKGTKKRGSLMLKEAGYFKHGMKRIRQ